MSYKLKAISVKAENDFTILVNLEDGRVLKMDMSFIKSESGPAVEPLKDIVEFKRVFIRDGIVTWSSGYDIDPYYLIEESVELASGAAI